MPTALICDNANVTPLNCSAPPPDLATALPNCVIVSRAASALIPTLCKDAEALTTSGKARPGFSATFLNLSNSADAASLLPMMAIKPFSNFSISAKAFNEAAPKPIIGNVNDCVIVEPMFCICEPNLANLLSTLPSSRLRFETSIPSLRFNCAAFAIIYSLSHLAKIDLSNSVKCFFTGLSNSFSHGNSIKSFGLIDFPFAV